MAEGVDTVSSTISTRKEKEGKPLVVILIGAPGSGKTTFCNDVINTGRRIWTRICQDTIANGKAGTKAQCLLSASNALQEGKNVLIDRCNLELEQRSEFVKLSGALADVHAVVLDLPAQVCISRSVKRTGHEGNLQGGKAAAVVNRMLQKKVLPKLNEGFSRITFCQDDGDVKNAVNTYRSLGLLDNLPSGVVGHKSADAKVQQGILKFLKKVDTEGNTSLNFVAKHECGSQSSAAKEINTLTMGHEKGNEAGVDAQINHVAPEPYVNDFQWNDTPTLAFPSISTSDFQFDQDKASDVIVETVSNFLNKVDKAKLILVDLSSKSKMLSLVRVKASKKNIDTSRFSTHAGDITQLYTVGGLHCHAIANAANWRLKPGGGGVNAAIFSAGGEALEMATKEQAETISPGSSIIVLVPKTSPLYQREGVAYVIHVLGPNMNTHRPNCLKNDYVKGCKVLYEAYCSLFDNFAFIAQNHSYQKEYRGDSHSGPSKSIGKSFEAIDEHQSLPGKQKSKREASLGSNSNKKFLNTNVGTVDHFPSLHIKRNTAKSNEDSGSLLPLRIGMIEGEKQKNERNIHSTKNSWDLWAHSLHQIAMHPEKHSSDIIEISNSFVVVNDLYPKAKKHLLVISRLSGLDGLSDIRPEHLPTLEAMHTAGLKWAEKFTNQDPSLVFRLGYHSVPSMRQLHLHVISQDFDSSFMKKKKHWNSFVTPFFRDFIDVEEEVKVNGLAVVKDEKLLSSELRCHRCKSAHPNIPRLKSHISICKAPLPSHFQNDKLLSVSSVSSEAVDADMKC